jgi:2,3,4,5-tetrahydropyridine-2,6-dicarboxylate N-succinyltransferase
MILQQIIERMYECAPGECSRDEVLKAVNELKDTLNSGEVRAAEPQPGGTWRVNQWVKKGILLAFRYGTTVPFSEEGAFSFFDRSTMTLRKFTEDDGVRIVPGGSSVRDGAYVAHGVVMMPPSYINIGAFVDEGTMIDSHALVGSCAQIGRRVHLSAAAQVGGVLEPIGSMPVIVEDDAFIGGNCGIYEGTWIGRRAVLAAGVILTRSTPVYDIVRETVHRGGDQPLAIPAGAVVVPGTRELDNPFARLNRLSISAPVIIKYRDEKTDASTVLEQSLR